MKEKGFTVKYTFIRKDGKKNTIARVCYANFITSCLFPRKQELYALNIPKGISCIEDHAFADCPQLKKVTFHEGLLSIKVGAFQGCGELEEVIIPKTVNKIGPYAFERCPKLKVVKVYSQYIDIASTAFDEGVEIQYVA